MLKKRDLIELINNVEMLIKKKVIHKKMSK